MTHARLRPARHLLALLWLGAPALALAHPGEAAHAHGFAAGLAHPFTGLDHLLAMLALGVWSALGARRVALAPLAFGAALLAGAAFGVPLPVVEPMIAASLLGLGLLLAGGTRLPALAGAGVAALFGVFHGAAHGQELSGPAALAGMAAASLLLQGAGLLLGRLLRERAAWLPRLAGTVLALFGASLLLA